MKNVFYLLILFITLPRIVSADFDDFDILIRIFPNESIDEIIADYPAIEEVEEEIIPGQVYLLEVDDADDLEPTILNLQDDPRVEWADFNFFSETPEGTRRTLAVIDTDPSPSEYFDQTVMERIRTSEAHSITQGSGMIVAVVDTGVDYNHSMLADQILRDSSDDVIGYDFIEDDEDPIDSTNGEDDDSDGDIDEGAGHGTHVAGIISLVAPQAKIMPVRVLDSEGFGTSFSVYMGVLFALENGAHVINLSLGMDEESKAIEDIVDIALGGRNSGFLTTVVASAGNAGLQIKHYPAAQTGDMIAVTATDPYDVKADFSNFDTWVDLCSPGVGIYSTFINEQYATWDGTSMAAPFVSGLSALIRSLNPLNQPSAEHVRNIALLGADSIYAINPAYKQMLGSGRVNLLNPLLIENGAVPLRVKKARYRTDLGKLIVEVERVVDPEEEDPGVPTVTIEGHGVMKYNATRDLYTYKISLPDPPESITIRSSDGLIITAYVQTN